MADSSPLTFRLYPLRFFLEARAEVRFPATAGNKIRGALGQTLRAIAREPANCAYARLFEPAQGSNGRSGIDHPPRPFILRAAHLNGGRFHPGDRFHFDLHLFDVSAWAEQAIELLLRAVQSVAEGMKLRFVSAARIDAPSQALYGHPFHIALDVTPGMCARLQIEFVTPTELKHGGEIAKLPEFVILFRRVQDRISNLCAIYDRGALPVDFRSLADRASLICLESHRLRSVEQSRRSSKTGQVHGLNGWTGMAEYAGDLTEFLPWLYAAEWAGVGRQTVWGKGQIKVHVQE